MNYAYDVNASLPVVLDDGERKYVWGNGLAYSVSPTGTVLVYHTDGLGSVRALTDGSGNVVQTYETDEFGISTLTSGSSTQPFQYTGEPRDAETGFVYLRARLYDPAVGRFVSQDPYAGILEGPRSLNRFAYAVNNPATLRDPSGLDPLGDWAHARIQEVFLEGLGYRSLGWEKEYTYPGGRIDLFQQSTGFFYEIKPWNQAGKGEEQIRKRIADSFALKRNPPFTEAPHPFPEVWIGTWVPGLRLHAYQSTTRGLVLYEFEFHLPPPLVFPFPGKRPSKLPKNFPNLQPRPIPGLAAFGAPTVSAMWPPGGVK